MKAVSSSQMGQFKDNASAKYSLSLLCGEILDALNKKDLNLSSEINPISSVFLYKILAY